MGQQVLAVAGQVVGGYFFGPVGAAIGGAIGGYLGGVLFNEDQVFEGPRLSDLKIQSSNWGNAVPLIYGTVRVAGNVIWATDIRETRLETEQGKGGPETTQVDYQYDLDVAVALGEPPLGLQFEGIERIYANGVLIYDTRAGAVPASVFASGQWATSTYLYPGTETQMPDPIMEAALGVGNVPAYRGTGYIVIGGLQLNVLKTSVMPNFEFVVSTSATVQLGRQLFEESVQPPYRVSFAGNQPYITQLTTTIRVANTDDLLVRVYDLNGALLGTEERAVNEEGFPEFSRNGGMPFAVWKTFDHKSAEALFGTLGGGGYFTIDAVDMLAVIPLTGPDLIAGVVASVDQRNYLVMTRPAAGPVDTFWHIEWDGVEPILRRQGSVENVGNNDWNISPVYQGSGAHYVSVMESDLQHVWQMQGTSLYVWEINSDPGSPSGYIMERIINFGSGTLPLKNLSAAGTMTYSPGLFADGGLASLIIGDADLTQSWLFLYSRKEQVTPSGMTLVDILTDLSERSDLPASELTFVNLPDTVFGFVVGQTMSARSAMEVLRPAYYFDAVDSDTFKFVKRGAASIVDVAYVDLGAGTDAPTIHAVSVNRAQETEIPARINVKYMSVAADYQIAAQSARRETTGSREIAEVNLPIVFDDDNEVAGIADILLRERWAGAFTRSYATTIEYAKYEPTDVVRLDDGLAVRTVRVRARTDKGSLIEWESIDEDVEAYDSNAVAASVSVPAQVLAPQGESALAILDIPPLTELADGNESAAYVAAKGYLPNWPGAAIDVSRNNGGTYTAGTSVTQASVMGAAITALDDFLGGNVWDEASTVQVDVGVGTLSSATHAEVLDGANYIVIGEEVLQYRTATLVSAGLYDLTGFLRGRKGTEWAIAGHLAGDKFVLLSTNLRNLPLNLADRALDDLYVRATTGSMLPSSGTVRTFAPRISRLMPYSPVHLSGVRNTDATWHLTWERRDRYSNDWNSGVDIPMSEASELYDVEIYNVGSELVGTYTDVSDTELDIDDDVLGGSPTPTTLTFSVWQKSAIVGRGFEANETITQAL